jgi:hypothetical protein
LEGGGPKAVAKVIIDKEDKEDDMEIGGEIDRGCRCVFVVLYGSG